MFVSECYNQSPGLQTAFTSPATNVIMSIYNNGLENKVMSEHSCPSGRLFEGTGLNKITGYCYPSNYLGLPAGKSIDVFYTDDGVDYNSLPACEVGMY